jgi:hypothetical protein
VSTSTVGEARAEYFARNGFSTASYQDRWVRLRLFGIPIVFPNVRSRRRAIPFHDIHHVVTGYGTDPRGEAEIGAWEIAATLPDRGIEFAAAWVLNSAMFAIGMFIAPRRVYRAFVRGCHCTSLYRLGWSDQLLARDVAGLRAELGVDPERPATWRDRVRFAATLALVALPGASLATACVLLATR